MTFAQVRKAVFAAVSAGVAALVPAWPDGVTSAEAGTIVAAMIVAGYGVFRIKNKPGPGPARRPGNGSA
jgi:hypothetical protein